ncbi:MAG: 16S rRNA (adenine(1518)-N(6)/adenine(1519)-N(6))-dimethyltransferase RsmA [bacterium]
MAKKSLGQNFLVHGPILQTIARKILENPAHTILEIGPGPGSLSQLLAPHVKRLLLVEKDLQFKTLLEEVLVPLGNVEIHVEDFLKTDLKSLISPRDVPALAVGNLPYNASVAILQKLLESRALFQRLYLMFQKEVAQRLTARPNTSAYGSLSVYVQMQADVKTILPIPPSAFDPRPKIQSAVVEITPLPALRFPDVDFDFFQKVTQAAFNPRRKTLSNTLKGIAPPQAPKKGLEELLESIRIDPKRRGETLSLQEFAALSEALKKWREG